MKARLRSWLPALSAVSCLSLCGFALAQPGNDLCATVAAGGFDIPGTGGSVSGTTVLATSDGESDCGNGAGADVFYRFTPSISGPWRMSLCSGTTVDTVLSLHSGCPADLSTEIDCDDDGCGIFAGPSRLTVTVSAGTTYIIRVGLYGPTTTSGAFNLDVAPILPITNDNCSDVLSAAAVIPGTGGSVAGTTEGATNDGDCSCDDGDPGALDVYYKFVPATSGNWQFSLCNGTTIDTAMSIHSGCPADASTEIICNDDGCGGIGVPSQLSVALTGGTQYIVRVAMWDSTDTTGGPFILTVTDLSNVAPGQTCGNPIALSLGSPVSGDLADSMVSSTITCSSGVKGLWYSFTAPASGSYLFDSTLTTGDGNPSLGLFAGDCATELDCVNPCLGTNAQAVRSMAQDETVVFRVGGCADAPLTWSVSINVAIVGACCDATSGICSGTNTGAAGCASGTTYQGDNSTCEPNPCPQPPPPANDECAHAIGVTVGSTASGTNIFATQSIILAPDASIPICDQDTWDVGAPDNQKDVFFSFVAPATTEYTINTCGSSFDTTISLHSACPIDQSNLVTCNDDSTFPDGSTGCANSGLNSRIPSVSLTQGTTYLVRVWGYNGQTGTISLTVDFVNPPSGVCCRGATCTTAITDSAACSASLNVGQTAGASFSAAASCNSGALSNSPCCYADYNKTGGITVTDIFNFLADWFAGSAFANVGGTGSGGPLTVQNIFDFLSNWFAGGC